ncbi:site-specific integrase [Myxococcota bacterium]|nr:site-specific integrase [Myxococcota bacterium]
MKVKLTKGRVERIEVALGAREAFGWDDAVPGFGVRVLPSGRRSYIVQYFTKGRTRRLTLGPHGVYTVEQARKRAASLLASVREGGDPSAERHAARTAPTVAELLDRYFKDYAEPRKKPKSLAQDRDIARRFLLPKLGRLRVADVTRDDLQRIHSALRDTPVMANRTLAMASTLFGLAERWDLRAPGTNPARYVERYREATRERYLSPAELAALGEALAEREEIEPAGAIDCLRMLILTGCRVSEIRCLRWPEVDIEGARLLLKDSKTGGRVVPLNAPAREILARRPRRNEYVFPARRGGRPLPPLQSVWQRVRERAGLPDVRMHDLRHGFASVGASSGQSLLIIGALLGHRRVATTARYAHLSNDPVRDASEAIGAKIAAAMKVQPTEAQVLDIAG